VPGSQHHVISSMFQQCKLCYKGCKMCLGPSIMDCFACYPPYGYSSVQRQCTPCCTDQSGTDNCCHCIEEGKCAALGNTEENKLFNQAAIVIVVLSLVIVVIIIFITLLTYLYCRKKPVFSSYSYGKLRQEDINSCDS